VLNLEELIYGIHSIWRVSTLETYRYTMSKLLSSSFGFLCLLRKCIRIAGKNATLIGPRQPRDSNS